MISFSHSSPGIKPRGKSLKGKDRVTALSHLNTHLSMAHCPCLINEQTSKRGETFVDCPLGTHCTCHMDFDFSGWRIHEYLQIMCSHLYNP